MKAKLVKTYNRKFKKGHEIEIDRIKCDIKFAHGFGVRAIGLSKKPVWLTIAWIVEIPGDVVFIPVSVESIKNA